MILGTYEFYWEPTKATKPDYCREIAYVTTFTSVAFYDFGLRIIGQEILLEWDWMPISQYEALRAMFLSGENQSWYPGDGSAYTVKIIDLQPNFFKDLAFDTDFDYLEKVKLCMVIVSCDTATPSQSTTTTTTTSSSTTTTTTAV